MSTHKLYRKAHKREKQQKRKTTKYPSIGNKLVAAQDWGTGRKWENDY